MDTKEQVTATKKEIEKCIAYLMNSLKERLSEKRVRTYKDEEGNIKNREDFRYDFEMQFDELPYFSLYVNLKKAVYEKLLVPCHKANALNENDMEDLAKVGVTEEKGELKFKSLKDFVPKSKYLYCMDIDLGALEEYLDEIEVSLLYSIHSNPVLAILNNLFDGESLVQNQIGADGVLPKSALDEEGYLDEDLLYELKKETEGNWFYSSTLNEYDNFVAEKAGKDFVFPCGEHIGRIFMERKEIIEYAPTSKKGQRDYVIQRINANQYKMFCAVLDTVVSVLTTPAYEIPHETILDILEQTLAGMKRVVFAKKLDTYTSGGTKLFSKGELAAALGCKSEKFSKYTNIYGDKSFAEEEIHAALEKLGQPVDLLDF